MDVEDVVQLSSGRWVPRSEYHLGDERLATDEDRARWAAEPSEPQLLSEALERVDALEMTLERYPQRHVMPMGATPEGGRDLPLAVLMWSASASLVVLDAVAVALALR